MSFKTEWACLDFDLTCLYLGRQAEKDPENSGETREPGAPTGYNSAKGLVRRKVKRKADGTW